MGWSLSTIRFRDIPCTGTNNRNRGLITRHPSQIEGESVKAAEVWNNWFTVNHVNNVNSILAHEFNGPIKGRRWLKLNRNDARSKNAQTINPRDQAAQLKANKLGQSQSSNNLAGTKIQQKLKLVWQFGEKLLQANYKDDKNLRKNIKIVKNPTNGKIRNLDSHWCERLWSLPVDENDLLYIDDRLVIPKLLQGPIKVSLHWGHQRRDQILRQISNIRWQKFHRDITLQTKTCRECQEAGGSIKTLLKQKQFGKIPNPENITDEIAIDFAGPFKIARSSKKYLIVSVDSKSGWPDAKFFRSPTVKKELAF